MTTKVNQISDGMKVLIPAMEKRSALAAARSLGRKGIEVIGSSENKRNPGFFSKYCAKKYLYRSPCLDVAGYIDDIFEIIKKEKPDLFMPVNEETLLPLLKRRADLEKIIALPLSNNEVMEKVLNKKSATEIAENLNIPCPKKADNLSQAKFPLIARPTVSARITDNRVVSEKLFYVNSLKEAESIDASQYFFQEYFPGGGYGFYALFDSGRPLAYFMMKRLHEVPFTGGPSSLRESVYEEKLKEYGLRILSELKWHGLAMVEFRRDERDGNFKFIEINGRLWGSLALSINAGVDFPYLLCQMAKGEKIQEVFDYKKGVKGRWLAGDASYLFSVLFKKKVDKRPSRFKALVKFFNFFPENICYDYFAKDDLKPAFANLWLSFPKLFKKIILWR